MPAKMALSSLIANPPEGALEQHSSIAQCLVLCTLRGSPPVGLNDQGAALALHLCKLLASQVGAVQGLGAKRKVNSIS